MADDLTFDPSLLMLRPLTAREHLLDRSIMMPLQPLVPVGPELKAVAARLAAAKVRGAAAILMMGAHVLRSGVQRYLIDLMEQGYLSVIAMNGAGVIHDYEFALIGATTESVSRYIQEGQFGLWQETGRINDIVAAAARDRRGLGEAVGRVIEEEGFPHGDISVLAAGYRLGIPITVHVGIGYDIVHEHPNCDGAAYGATSYTDFLRFTKVLEKLQGGVVMNFGSAVMGPEVFLKGLAMVRNLARQQGRQVAQFTTLVGDLHKLPGTYHHEAPKEDPGYYFRPWKTMLVRTVTDGGESFYVQGPHAATIPQLWTALQAADSSTDGLT
jgi:hypothetical protein